jgi:hypothetical protein
MKQCIFYFLVFIACLQTGIAQKTLLIERRGTPVTQRIEIYDDLTFQLRNDDAGWYTRTILDLDPNAQLIFMGDTWVSIDDIVKIKLSRQRAIANILGGALQVGGISMFLGDVWYTVAGNPEFSQGGMEFGVLNFVVGTAIRKVFAPIRYRIGNKRRLRVVDLTF